MNMFQRNEVALEDSTDCSGESKVTRVVLRPIAPAKEELIHDQQTVGDLVQKIHHCMDVVEEGKKNDSIECLLDLQVCALDQSMESVLRQTLLRNQNHHRFFDGLRIAGEELAQILDRFEDMAHTGRRIRPRYRWGFQVAHVIRDVLRAGTIQQLALTSMCIEARTAKVLFEGLRTTRRNRGVQRLRLRGCTFDDVECGDDSPAWHLARGLAANTTLTCLDLSMIGWTDRQLAQLLEALVGHRSLRLLDLEGSVLGPRSISALKRLLEDPACRIRLLDVSRLNQVGDDDLLIHHRQEDALHHSTIVPLDKDGLFQALFANHSVEQLRLHQNGLCSYFDMTRLIHLLKHHPRIYQLTHDEFFPDGTPQMKTIRLRSTIRAWLHYHNSCQFFIRQFAQNPTTAPSVWPHCLERVNRISRTNAQRAPNLYPLVQAMVGVPGAIIGSSTSSTSNAILRNNNIERGATKRRRSKEGSTVQGVVDEDDDEKPSIPRSSRDTKRVAAPAAVSRKRRRPRDEPAVATRFSSRLVRERKRVRNS